MGIFDKIFGKSSSSNKTPKAGEADILVDQSGTCNLSNRQHETYKDNVLVDQSVTRLIEIYELRPEGFSISSNGALENEIKAIGVTLNQQGGMSLMLAVHDKFKANCGIYGAPHNLEFMWDGIGEWIG